MNTNHPYHQPCYTSLVFNQHSKYSLTVRQQPRKARLCSFRDKVDRRPLDPPPIIELHQKDSISFNNYHNSSNFFLHTTLVNSMDHSDIGNNRTTAGSVVQSLHKLKDTNNAEGAFFIFADISIRIEGVFKLKFTLFEIKGVEVERICSIYSDPFQVYSPKSFPGMSESTDLTRTFSDQGLRIRIRKEARAAIETTPSMKRRRDIDQYHVSTLNTTANVMSMKNLLISEQEQTPSPPPPTMKPSDNYYYTSSSSSPPAMLSSLSSTNSYHSSYYGYHSPS